MADDNQRVQGNVAHSFGREHGVYLLFELVDGAPGRKGLKEIARAVTSSDAQEKARKDKDVVLGMVGLSSRGYFRLGLDKLTPKPVKDEELGAAPFREGVRAASYSGERALEQWEAAYRDHKIDGFLLLASDSEAALAAAALEARKRISACGRIIAEEVGNRIRRPPANDVVEQFGFAEGKSRGEKDEPAAVFVDGGCFAAFLKIEQHVDVFERRTTELANAAGVGAEEVREALIGKTRAGQFVDEARCPYHAHVRLLGRRDGAHQRFIVRRGMTYGHRGDLTAAGLNQLPPSSGVGLLFLSFQRSLHDFTALMMRAASQRDPVLARGDDPHGYYRQEWTFKGALLSEAEHQITGLTTIRGGEYFHVPPMEFFEKL